MLALSTSWKSGGSTTAGEMISAIKSLDVSAIELSYRISQAMFHQLKGLLKRSGQKVVSVHNYFPVPSVRSEAKGSGDLFLLSSPENAERQNAIHYTTKTIEYAAELGAGAVVLHCGVVEINPEMQALYRFLNSNQIQSRAAQALIRNKLKELEQRKPIHLDSLLASLDHLASVAAKHKVLLGLENRYHYHELPGPDDFKIIFEAFKGAPIGYWHDTGHAHANEILGFIPKNALLQKYADRLIGFHLHDALGLDDHIPPGAGEIDFESLKPYLKTGLFIVIEVKPGIPASDVSEGIRFVREQLAGA